MKIIDLKSAIIGTNVCLRVVTDKGIDGYSQVENFKENEDVDYNEVKATSAPVISIYAPIEEDEMMTAAEPFECYKWNRFDQNIIDFFGGDKTILVGCTKNKKQKD